MINLSQLVKKRFTSKAFDPTKKISQENITELKNLLQFCPSSVNSQPWHFVITDTEAGKAAIAASTEKYAFNTEKVTKASHIIVLCTKNYMDDEHLETLLQQEDADGRFADETIKQNQHAGRTFFTNMHRFEAKDLQHWMEKQTYIALGTLLLGASVLDIDATPIEGFDATTLNQDLDLQSKGYTASLIVALGYHDEADLNAKLPKSRLPQSTLFTEL